MPQEVRKVSLKAFWGKTGSFSRERFVPAFRGLLASHAVPQSSAVRLVCTGLSTFAGAASPCFSTANKGEGLGVMKF